MDLKNTAQDAEPPAHEQIQGDGQKEEIGYTFCDGCNEVPFCGIKFFKRGDVVTKVESWPAPLLQGLCHAAAQLQPKPAHLSPEADQPKRLT